MNYKKSIRFLMCLPMLFIAACSEEAVQEPMDEVILQLVWKHQAQFSGFYAAELNGFYKEENIKVTIHPRITPTFNVINEIVTGEADFGVTYAIGVLEARENKMPVKAIASIYRRFPLSFISLQENAITHPLDFVGKRIPVLTPGGASVLFDVLLKKNNIDRKTMTFIQTGYDLDRLFSGDVDVWAGYTTNEVLVAFEKGFAINQVKPEDFGVNMMGDTLFTSDILLNTNPDLVLRFVRASLRGWQWAVEHPEAAGRMALQFDSALEPAHQEAMMKASIPYIQKGSESIGMMENKVWQEMHDTLLEQGLITSPLNINAVYTNNFVEQIYQVQ